MELNPQQLEAVQHREGPLLILAGAGTGKTRVLVHRIAHLVNDGDLSPGRILAVTFTNKAAGEMKKRLETLVGARARELWVGTFHSVCVKILRRHVLEAGLAPQFVIYDDGDQQSVIKQVLRDLNLDDKKLPPGSLVNKISRLKDQLIGADDYAAHPENPYEKTLAKIYAAYRKILEVNRACDFGDLIFRCVKLFETHPVILTGYQKLWRQILIDEYQDTNHAQYRWANLLAAQHKNLCVVGDPDQSIYRWRGADLHNILNFEKDYPQAKVIRLEQNYRSVTTVLKAASAVIAHNELRKEKMLWGAREEGAKITAASLNSEKKEAAFVVENLQKLHTREKISYADMAVFYRTNAQSRALEEVLRMAGVPYIIYGGIRFYERAEIKDALAYLRVFYSPQDSVSLKRIINVPSRGIGKTTIDRIGAMAAQNNLSFYQAAGQFDGSPRLKSFLDWFEKLRGRQNELGLVGLLQTILETSGYLESLSKQGTFESQERVSNINELIAGIAELGDVSLQDYLERIALITDLDQKTEGGMLPLMTLHLAKGLEFKAVAVVGLEEGLLPHSRSQDELEELEEERRLFYVGLTRARERLILTHAWRRFLNGQEQYSLPSRFLEEIPGELLEMREAADHGKHWDESEAQEEYEEDQGPRTRDQGPGTRDRGVNFPAGIKVRHPDFGVGYVAASEQTSLGEKVTVKFSNGMIKKLIAEYAQLKRL
ncbi:MAG: UvrD-helicase domain-containing protein [Deltaproteobacteria bacterium]|nr:UvrD-helicase domain-containing protein [Deltaproteobacteria bacterium]